MSGEIETNVAQYHYSIQCILRAARDCSQKCNVFKRDELSSSDNMCLRKCSINHAVANQVHQRFLINTIDEAGLK